jgi:hypothetical protein
MMKIWKTFSAINELFNYNVKENMKISSVVISDDFKSTL